MVYMMHHRGVDTSHSHGQTASTYGFMDELTAQNRWLDTSPSDWNAALARELLSVIQDDAWKAVATLATRTEDVEAQLALLDGGLESSALFIRSNATAQQLVAGGEVDDIEDGDVADELREAIETRLQLLQLHDKARTWQELRGSEPLSSSSAKIDKAAAASPPDPEHDVESSWQFDDDDNEDENENVVLNNVDARDPAEHLPSLPDFLDTPIVQLAYNAAADSNFTLLHALFNRHAPLLSSHRLAILDRVPLFTEIDRYIELLPQVDTHSNSERPIPGESWRSEQDAWESSNIAAQLGTEAAQGPSPRSAEHISAWYRKRVESIDRTTGRVDSCLALIQYGASQGVPSLDAIGEQLSLLAKLVYDASGQSAPAEDWTLAKWQAASPSDIVQAYLSGSTQTSVVADIRKMALPYLYVLESQQERAGAPDPTLHDRLLYEWLLQASSSHLGLGASVFEASKPTLRPAQRVIRDDTQLVRLALAIAYSYQGTASWEALTAIFDCLPALENSVSDLPPDQTLHLVLSGPTPVTAFSLYESLQSWSQSALSRALDEFDLHLEAAEIFSRWSVPKPLSFFVTLSGDGKQQMLWADRLARTSASAVNGRGGGLGGDFEYEDDWISLLDDLCKLAGDEKADGKGASTGKPRPVFGFLDQREITRIFFSGLLSSESEHISLSSRLNDTES